MTKLCEDIKQNIPTEMENTNNWLIWNYRETNNKKTKIPAAPWSSNHKGAVDPTDPENHTEFETALDFAKRHDAGIGFVFTEEDAFVGIDGDDLIEDSELNSLGTRIVNSLDSYTEISPSGKGFHIITKSEDSIPSIKNTDKGIEIYSDQRFFTVTGDSFHDDPKTVNEENYALKGVIDEFRTKPKQDSSDDSSSSESNDPDVGFTDDELLEKARNAENGIKFEQLWSGDTSGYESHSEADLALLCILAFWTQGDQGRMERLFSQSGLNREKWRNRRDYRDRTIENAISMVNEYYDPESDASETMNIDISDLEKDPSEGDSQDGSNNSTVSWNRLREIYSDASNNDSDLTLRDARFSTAKKIVGDGEYITFRDTKNLYKYNPDEGIYENYGKSRMKTTLTRELRSYATKNNTNEILNQVKSLTYVEREDVGPEEGFLPVNNGILDLETQDLRDYSSDNLITWKIPVSYDPEADCPRFKNFLDQVVPKDKIDVIQEFMGYTLHHWGMPFEKALMLVGVGSNGKSTFLNILRKILGEENIPTHSLNDLSSQNHRFYTADLYGALANINADIDPDKLNSTGTFKQLTGGDKLRGERKHEDPFFFTNTAKLIFSAQEVPTSDDDTVGFWRRWILIEFPNIITKEDKVKDLDKKIIDEEASGILNWMIEGYKRLMEQEQFSYNRDPDQIKLLWRNWGDLVSKFTREYLKIDTTEKIRTDKAFKAYKKYCNDRNEAHLAKNLFSKRLNALINKLKIKRLRIEDDREKYYKGITWKKDPEKTFEWEKETNAPKIMET